MLASDEDEDGEEDLPSFHLLIILMLTPQGPSVSSWPGHSRRMSRWLGDPADGTPVSRGRPRLLEVSRMLKQGVKNFNKRLFNVNSSGKEA